MILYLLNLKLWEYRFDRDLKVITKGSCWNHSISGDLDFLNFKKCFEQNLPKLYLDDFEPIELETLGILL